MNGRVILIVFTTVSMLLLTVEGSRATIADVCEGIDRCKRATLLRPKEMKSLFSYLGLHYMNDVMINSDPEEVLEAVLKDNIELRFRLYGGCSDDGEYLSFIDKNGVSRSAPRCAFSSDTDELLARNHIRSASANKVTSQVVALYQSDSEVAYIIMIFFLLFIAMVIIFTVYESIQRSIIASRNGHDLSKQVMMAHSVKRSAPSRSTTKKHSVI